MQDPVFFGHSAIEWEEIAAIAATVAALASLTSTVIVAFVAKFTFNYMHSTKELVEAARSQSDASIRQANASIKMLELMNIERRETDSFQRAVFIHSLERVVSALGHYIGIIGSPAKPWHEGDCWLLPSEWDICRAFVSRNAPGLLEEMQLVEKDMSDLSCAVQGYIRAPDSLWLSTIQRRSETVSRLTLLGDRMTKFKSNALKPAAST
jgi:hypothetical protein